MPQETTCVLLYLNRVKQGELPISFHELRNFDNSDYFLTFNLINVV